MDNKETPPNSPDSEAEVDEAASSAGQRDSADALNMTPEELEEERAAKAAADTDAENDPHNAPLAHEVGVLPRRKEA